MRHRMRVGWGATAPEASRHRLRSAEGGRECEWVEAFQSSETRESVFWCERGCFGADSETMPRTRVSVGCPFVCAWARGVSLFPFFSHATTNKGRVRRLLGTKHIIILVTSSPLWR